ncbi:hypothetical protein [Luteibacter yeojuensis]|uniref:Uncharacterized protein n=1 Tax=Luteibacter yeojuensis TaxID=345309 RepID=A0A7X5QS16_9GAMM|nr:hypothetical protein [Luteibacter yeojuensis]NID14383.1 hypothetical protein [Luteibacter yeojuensis]
MNILEVLEALSKVQSFDLWSRNAVNDARLYLTRIHNDNIIQDARIAKLTAEVDRLREALEVIAKLGATDGLNAKLIARRALEGDTTTTPERREG